MAMIMGAPADIEAACAICGFNGYPECPHEGQRLELAMDQALERWAGVQDIRDWVLNHARNQVIQTFQRLKAQRVEQHNAYLQTLPCYSLYHQYNGHPPMHPFQLQALHNQISQANAIFKQGVDEDWRRSCMRYPDVLDYYFSMVTVNFPEDKDPAVRNPVFGQPLERTRKIKARRDEEVMGGGDMEEVDRAIKKKEGRKSRGRTPPPSAPMPAMWGRGR
ncbi:hypothetical protein K431DRAFT_280663 [Polychaeton citri CBS 116435]|uniref:Uncharacterized protein n=1 Tax=Polychaeton citri CBS 116435 TaxID=1314669 RepID=A0A9P4QGN7_9PEZI|nr:hypothetical protein K431DRAFT_280663 [Polychaeton citri CBS 116435]